MISASQDLDPSPTDRWAVLETLDSESIVVTSAASRGGPQLVAAQLALHLALYDSERETRNSVHCSRFLEIPTATRLIRSNRPSLELPENV